MINDEADEVIKEPSESVFDYVHLLYYKCHKISPNHCGWYVDSPDWIKNKKAIKNIINAFNVL